MPHTEISLEQLRSELQSAHRVKHQKLSPTRLRLSTFKLLTKMSGVGEVLVVGSTYEVEGSWFFPSPKQLFMSEDVKVTFSYEYQNDPVH